MEPNGCPIHFRSNVHSLTEQPDENARRKSRSKPNGAEAKKTGSARADTIDKSIIHLLHRASQRASEIFAQETRDFDLTARQYAVITTVAQHEGLSQTDLVRLTGIDRSTLADVVQRLLKRGVI